MSPQVRDKPQATGPTHRPRLLASYFTLAGNVLPMTDDWTSPHPLQRRAAAASSAGYIGMGLSHDDLEHCVAEYGYEGVRGILADNSIEFLEFEMLLDWFADGQRRAASDKRRHRLLDAAEKLGAYQIKVGAGMAGEPLALERFIKDFGDLCRQAAGVGVQICIELSPISNVQDLPTGLAIVQGAGAANGGLLLDIWHVVRGDIPFDDIAGVPAGCLKHVELDDAARRNISSMLEDTIHRRRLPGQGDFNIPGFLKAVARTGYDGLYGVEIISDAHRLLTPEDAAHNSYNATVGQMALSERPEFGAN